MTCLVCNEAVASDALTCQGCGTAYHRKCRLGAGRCVKEGCKRSQGIETTSSARNDSVLQMNVFPFVFGAFFAGAVVFFLPVSLALRAAIGFLIFIAASYAAHHFWGDQSV